MKKRKIDSYRLIELMLVITISTIVGMLSAGGAVFSIMQNKMEANSKTDELGEITNTYNKIVNNYYKEVNKDELIEGAINGMLSVLDDPHSLYLNDQDKSSFDDRLNGEYKGLGLEIANDLSGNVLIISIFENSAASESDLKVGDIINKVEGEIVKGKNSSDVAYSIKQNKKDVLTLEIIRDSKTMEIEITKRLVTINSVSSKMIDSKTGYLKLNIFANNSFSQFKSALLNLEKNNLSGLIIDLRGNSGGYLYTVSDMLGLFIKKGEVLYRTESQINKTEVKDETEEHRNYKIVILVDSNSASASELMAISLRESYGAVVVGKTTYGKGTIQHVIDVGDNSAAKLTTQKWLSPKGNWIHEIGVVPDYDVDLSLEYYNNPIDIYDTQLRKAIELLK